MAAAEAKTTDAVLFQPKSFGEAQAETVATMLEIRPCADLWPRAALKLALFLGRNR